MVDYSAPSEQLVTTEAPQRIDTSVIARAHQDLPGIGPGLQALGQGLDDVATSLAQKKGQQDAAKAVTIGPDGKVQVTTPDTSIILGKAGVAYQHAVEAGTVAGVANSITPAMTDLHQQFAGDPAAFMKAAGTYAQSLREKFPGPLGEDAFQRATSLTNSHYNSLVNDKATLDETNAHNNITTQISDAQNRLVQIARGGGQETPEFLSLQNQVTAWRQNLVGNPRFPYTDEKAASDNERFSTELRYAGVTGMVDQWKKDGRSVDKMVEFARKNILEDPSSVPENERAQAYNWAIARINFQTEEQKSLIQQSSANVQAMQTLYRSGKPPTDAQYDAQVDTSRNAGDQSGVEKLAAARAAYMQMRPLAPLSPLGATASLMGPNAAVRLPASVGGFGNAVNRTFGFEGGLLSRDTNGTPSNYGINQAAHPEVDVSAITKDQARGIYKTQYWDAIGGDTLPPQLAHVAFDTAVIAGPARAREMIQQSGGDPSKFMQLREGYLTSLLQSNPEKYGRFAQAWSNRNASLRADIGAPPDGSPIPFTPQQIRDNPYLVSAAVEQFSQDHKTQIDMAGKSLSAAETRISAGVIPHADELAGAFQVVAAHPNEAGLQAQATKVRAALAAAPVAEQMSGMSPGAAQQVLDQADTLARTQPSLYNAMFAQQLHSQNEARHKRLADNPHAFAAEAGWTPAAPPPIDPSDAGSVVAGIQARRKSADAISVRTGQAPEDLTFSKVDTQGLTQAMAATPGDKLSPLMTGLSKGLTDREFSSLTQDKDFSGAVSGMLRSGDPMKMQQAFGFMNTAYKRNPLAFERDFPGDAKMLDVYETHIQFVPAEDQVKEMTKALDPGQRKALEETRTAADENLKSLNPGNVVQKLYGSSMPLLGRMWTPGTVNDLDPNVRSQELLNDFKTEYRERYALDGNDSAAQKFALDRIGQKWGTSVASGGQLMRYPPEKSYPQLGDSHDWIKGQLDETVSRAYPISADMQKRLEDPAALADMDAATARNWAISHGEHVLIADDYTRRGMLNAAGKDPKQPDFRGPSYQIATRGADGLLHALEASPGNPMRFAPSYREAEIAAATRSADIAAGRIITPGSLWRGVTDAANRRASASVAMGQVGADTALGQQIQKYEQDRKGREGLLRADTEAP